MFDSTSTYLSRIFIGIALNNCGKSRISYIPREEKCNLVIEAKLDCRRSGINPKRGQSATRNGRNGRARKSKGGKTPRVLSQSELLKWVTVLLFVHQPRTFSFHELSILNLFRHRSTFRFASPFVTSRIKTNLIDGGKRISACHRPRLRMVSY